MKKRIVIATILVAIFSLNSINISASPYEERKQLKTQIIAIEEKINNLEKEKIQIQQEMKSVNSDIQDLSIQIQQAEKQIQNTEIEINQKQIEIEQKKKQLQKAKEQSDVQYEAMKKRIKYFYENSSTSISNALLERNFNLLLTNQEYMKELYESDRILLEEYIETTEKIKKITEQLQQKRKELVEKKHLFELQKIGLQENKELLDNKLIELQEKEYKNALDVNQYKNHAATLADKMVSLNSKIAEIQYQYAKLQQQYQRNESRTGLQTIISNEYISSQLDNIPKQQEVYENTSESSSNGSDIVQYANQFVGNPYVWGGNSLTNGIDCSHFVWNVLKDTGHYDGGYYIAQQWPNLGEKVNSLEQAQAGDVICYSGHVAIYDGQGSIIQAQSSRAGITNNRNADKSTILAIRRFE